MRGAAAARGKRPREGYRVERRQKSALAVARTAGGITLVDLARRRGLRGTTDLTLPKALKRDDREMPRSLLLLIL